MSSKNLIRIISLIIAFILGAFLSNRCSGEPKVEKEIVTETVIERHTDTTVVLDTVKVKEYISNIEYKYLTNTCDSNYYHQTFKKDSLYFLKTFGGYVDSIELQVYNKEITIRDSIVVNNTTTIKETKYRPYKNTISSEYIYNTHNNVLIDYTRNFNRVSVGGKIGLNTDTKTPIIGGKIGISF